MAKEDKEEERIQRSRPDAPYIGSCAKQRGDYVHAFGQGIRRWSAFLSAVHALISALSSCVCFQRAKESSVKKLCALSVSTTAFPVIIAARNGAPGCNKRANANEEMAFSWFLYQTVVHFATFPSRSYYPAYENYDKK